MTSGKPTTGKGSPRDDALAPLTRDSVTREVTARLIQHLTSGNLAPGARLPSERALADSLQVGRSAIRETLAALEVLGIVDSRPGSGTYLRESSADLLPTIINWGLAFGQARTLDLVEARAELEVVTARLAAQRATDDDIARLRQQLDRMREAGSSLDEFIDADVSFHLEVADITGNSVIGDILHSLRSLLQVWVTRAVKADGTTSTTLREHERVFEAIAARDEAAAAAAMKEHMHLASGRLRRSIGSEAS